MNHWNEKGVPHKGWTLIDVTDVRQDGQSEAETDYEACMMCGNEKIRYVHILKHPEVNEEFMVGCVCAEKMLNDYVNPKKKETHLRNKTNRRNNWINKEWKVNQNGNYYLKVQRHYLLIYLDGRTKKHKVKIDDTFGKMLFDDFDSAKIGAFNGVEYLKERGEW